MKTNAKLFDYQSIRELFTNDSPQQTMQDITDLLQFFRSERIAYEKRTGLKINDEEATEVIDYLKTFRQMIEDMQVITPHCFLVVFDSKQVNVNPYLNHMKNFDLTEIWTRITLCRTFCTRFLTNENVEKYQKISLTLENLEFHFFSQMIDASTELV